MARSGRGWPDGTRGAARRLREQPDAADAGPLTRRRVVPFSVADPDSDADPPRVALITIDGLRPEAVTAETTPQIWQLVARGAYTWSAQTIVPSNTLPSHTSMLTGVEPSVHGITFDE